MTRTSALLLTAMLAGCLSQPRAPETARYDLGMAASGGLVQAAQADAAALRTRVTAHSWLDDTSMHYRLLYVDALRTQTYAYARWLAPPAELFAQRLRQHLAFRTAGAGPAARLEVELEEFVQVFESPARSVGRITIHAQLLDGPGRRATFSEAVVAATPDAAGGAQALRAATDALIARLADWIGVVRSPGTGRAQLAHIEEMLEAHWLYWKGWVPVH